MYLEGSDQHRGWFQSSLMVALVSRERPPFREVLTHGFLIDLEGRKMSKSRGNAVTPQDVIEKSGAEVLRLWVAMCDYSEELRVSQEILSRVIEAYRKVRNTCRILVANLYDFDPATDLVPVNRLDAVDRYALSRFAERARATTRAYEHYEFPAVFHELNQLVTVDLSAFYIDVTKDRMYTFAARSRERRSTQSAMYRICDGLARLMAPILPVTADELWRHLPGSRSASVHLEAFPDVDGFTDPAVTTGWDRLIAVREQVNAALEEQRKTKVIGNSLTARVALSARGPVGALLERHAAELPMLFIVSDVALTTTSEGDDAVEVAVERAGGNKCRRCWRWVPAVRTGTGLGGPLRALRGGARRSREHLVHARFRPVELSLAGLVVALDQITKALVRSEFQLFESRTVIPEFFDLTRIHNTGTAFGLLQTLDFPFKTVVLILVASAALAGLAYYAATLPTAQRLSRAGLALVLGGGAGNLVDRVTLGYVVDFVDLYWGKGGWHFWAFNVADASITAGVSLMLLETLLPAARREG